MSAALQGGRQSGFDGSSIGDPLPKSGTPGAPGSSPLALVPNDGDDPNAEPPSPFAGLGPLLEDDDTKVFLTVDALVRRQEQIATNHLAQDTHYTLLKLGYPWSVLKKIPGKDVYEQEMPYGAKAVTVQAVPNKIWDVVNKTAEALLVDFPEVEAQPLDDSEAAQSTCEIANRFLTQDATEQGTNDAVLFRDRVEKGLVCATSYIEYWVDPSGGGYVPLEIKAHPQAANPQQPLLGPDGMPTSENVLRYVTGPIGADGKPGMGSRFTEDPSEAAPQWRPKICATKWNREHIRVYPETATVETCDKLIILGYCTLGEARKRWAQVAQMTPEELTQLTDWTPTRYLALLPPFQRARWKLSDGREKEKAGSSDERIMFYYHVLVKACPDYRKGANVVVTGAMHNRVLSRTLLAKDVEVKRTASQRPPTPQAPQAPQQPALPAQANDTSAAPSPVPSPGTTLPPAAPTATPPLPPQGSVKETRCMEIPVVAITPFGDPDDADPTGRSFVERVAGAAENNAFLAQSFSDIVGTNLHPEGYISATSPVEGWQREEARASGDLIPILRPGDMPIWGQQIPLNDVFFRIYDMADEAINSIAFTERAAQGADSAKERSGKALQIAVSQNSVGRTSPLNAVMNAYARSCRIKIELAMAEFSTEQQISYVGEDGAYTQDEWTGTDFALVGKCAIKAGTGTMLPPDQKVQYLAGLKPLGVLSDDEIRSAARSTLSKRLGIPADPHEQYVKRCIETWLKGPPSPAWAQEYQAWHAAQDAYQQQLQQYTQAKQLYDAAVQATAIAAGGPPPAKLGPEAQNEAAMLHYQMAVESLRTNPLPPAAPVQPQAPQTPKPWTPFTPRPNDTEPHIAGIWLSECSRVMSSVKYTQFGTEWQDVLIRQYTQARQAQAVGTTAQAQIGAPSAPSAQSSPAKHAAPPKAA